MISSNAPYGNFMSADRSVRITQASNDSRRELRNACKDAGKTVTSPSYYTFGTRINNK